MAGMDGVRTATELVERGASRQRIALLATGKVEPLHDGFGGLLRKPIRRADLYQLLETMKGQRAAVEPQRTRPASESMDANDSPAGQLRILLAEDNPVNQKLAIRMLEKLHCAVRLAGDGQEAVEAWLSEDFDLIFMDVQMPRMDGMQATRHIREVEEGVSEWKPTRVLPRHTPIVAITAHALAGDRERCLASGMDGYVTKPVTMAALATALKEYALPAQERVPTAQ